MKPLGRQPNSCGWRTAAKMKQNATKKKESAVGEVGPSSTMEIMMPTSTAIISSAYSTLSSWAAWISGWSSQDDLKGWNHSGFNELRIDLKSPLWSEI